MLKPVAMIGWSGVGSFEDLVKTAVRKLSVSQNDVVRVGDALLVTTDGPVSVASRLALLPGVSWIAVGYRFEGSKGYLKTVVSLAKRYLSKRKTFKISAQVIDSRLTAGDIILAGNSELLSAISGARVDERRAQVKFRVSVDGSKGACGVEIRAGPGGTPTGSEWVTCLVSGGARSAALSWMTALSGFSVRLVHSRTDDVALRQVAKLYSELSYRMDPSHLQLVALEGGKSTIGRIGGWLADAKGAVFAGALPEHPRELVQLAARFPNLMLPLIIVQDETIAAQYASLGLGREAKGSGNEALTLRTLRAGGQYAEKSFGGVQADSNTVIDALNRPR